MQEVLKEERVMLLTRQIRRKFSLSGKRIDVVNRELQKLDMKSLQELFDQVLEINTIEQLERWIANRLPKPNA